MHTATPRGAAEASTSTSVLDGRALAQRIASLRRASGLSQRRLAEAAGVSHGYIALLELGRLPSPGKFRLDAVARALGLRTADALLAPAPAGRAIDSLTIDRTTAESATPPGRAAQSASSQSAAPQSATPQTGAPQTGAPQPAPPQTAPPQPAPPQPAPPQSGATRRRDAPPGPRRQGPQPSTATTPATTPRQRPEPPHANTPSQPPVERVANVLGPLEQLRGVGARPLPVFRWGACGDPRDQESGPDPDRLEYPPPGRETLIGPHGFGVVVKGNSMSARGIYDGDVVWVNPERAYAVGKVVLAQVSDVDGDAGEAGMVVKTYARTEVGDCLLSETANGRSPLVCREFKVIGPVVGITSWRLPT